MKRVAVDGSCSSVVITQLLVRCHFVEEKSFVVNSYNIKSYTRSGQYVIILLNVLMEFLSVAVFFLMPWGINQNK